MDYKLKSLNNNELSDFINKTVDIINLTLIAFNIIKEKNVDVHSIKDRYRTLEDYNSLLTPWELPLTEEEFNILKGVIGNEEN